MPAQSKMHFYFNWAKERIDEMDATLASLEARAAEKGADGRAKAERLIADLRKKREEFQSTVTKQANASEAAWARIKTQLETEWNRFEAEVNKYLETVSKDVKEQQVVFQGQVAAQIKMWRETADKMNAAALKFGAERRQDLDTAVTLTKADAADAEKKLEKLARAGSQSWSALSTALAETRAAFDRANEAARQAFKQAGRTP